VPEGEEKREGRERSNWINGGKEGRRKSV